MCVCVCLCVRWILIRFWLGMRVWLVFSWTGHSETLSSGIPCEVDALEGVAMNVFQVSGCETLLRCYPPGMLCFSIFFTRDE
jgi:hypothetical protein